jgi:hypothetical protein
VTLPHMPIITAHNWRKSRLKASQRSYPAHRRGAMTEHRHPIEFVHTEPIIHRVLGAW